MIARMVPAALAALLLLAPSVQAQSWRTVTSSRQIWDTEPVEVKIEYGAGELSVLPADRGLLYRMELRYDEEQVAPLSEFDRESRKLRLGTRGLGKRGANVKEGGHARIALATEVSLDLELNFGAGEANLDLGGMRLRRLDLSTGASETTLRFSSPNREAAEELDIKAGAAELEVIGLGNSRAERIRFQGGVGATTLDFTGRWARDAAAQVQIGVGSVVLRFPRGLGVRLNRSSFLTSFDGEGLVKRGNSYYSPDWNRVDHKVVVDVDAAFGSIEVEWVDQ